MVVHVQACENSELYTIGAHKKLHCHRHPSAHHHKQQLPMSPFPCAAAAYSMAVFVFVQRSHSHIFPVAFGRDCRWWWGRITPTVSETNICHICSNNDNDSRMRTYTCRRARSPHVHQHRPKPMRKFPGTIWLAFGRIRAVRVDRVCSRIK